MPDETERLNEVFRALSDPTRRTMLDLLAQHGAMSVSQLAAHFPDLVRSGISKHLMVLRGAHLVHNTRQGRERVYQVNPATVQEVLRPWVARYEKFWAERMTRLKEAAEQRQADRERSQNSTG